MCLSILFFPVAFQSIFCPTRPPLSFVFFAFNPCGRCRFDWVRSVFFRFRKNPRCISGKNQRCAAFTSPWLRARLVRFALTRSTPFPGSIGQFPSLEGPYFSSSCVGPEKSPPPTIRITQSRAVSISLLLSTPSPPLSRIPVLLAGCRRSVFFCRLTSAFVFSPFLLKGSPNYPGLDRRPKSFFPLLLFEHGRNR